MKPISFREANTYLARDQEQYLPLPVFTGNPPEVPVIACFRLSFKERWKIFRSGILWVRQMTYGKLYHPILPEVKCPFIRNMDDLIDEELG